MQEQLSTLTMRVSSLESLQKDHMEQTQRIETNTADLIDTFKALQGAWKVLDWLGKLAKPIGVSIIVATAVWVWLKQFMPSWIAK